MLAALALLCASLLLAGCASDGYAGIRFAPGAEEPELQALAHRARAGDKLSQLELGIRYEQGDGVPVDLARAEWLYRAAASDAAGAASLYSPGTGSTKAGIIRVDRPQGRSGLAEARERFARLRLRRSGADSR